MNRKPAQKINDLGVLVEMEKKTTFRQLKPYKHYVSITCFNGNYQRNVRLFQIDFEIYGLTYDSKIC